MADTTDTIYDVLAAYTGLSDARNHDIAVRVAAAISAHIESREAAAAEAMRKACEARIYTYPIDCEMLPYTAMEVLSRDIALAGEIAALPLPAADALARALDRARAEKQAEEREAGALIAVERGAWASNDADAESLVDRLEARGRMDMASEIASAIRAQGKETNNG